MNSLAALAGRILLALIFLLSGIDKVVHYAQTLGYMRKAGLPFPEVLLIASIIIEIGGLLPVIARWKKRRAAAPLVLWVISLTPVVSHSRGGPEQKGPLMK